MSSNPVSSQPNDSASNQKVYFDIRKLYSFAIQEDVKSILTILDSLHSSELDPKDSGIKEKYYKRFVGNDEVYDYNTTDDILISLIDIYKEYWKSFLLKERSIENADSVLGKNLYKFVKKNYPLELSYWNEAEAAENPWLYLSRILSKNNYFNNVDGKTGNLFDIYIWRAEDTVIYDVDLPEVNINVPVIFMNDIVTMGWEEFATFGKAYPGGWPKNNALYCVTKAYDTTSEYFLVSYLAHEAQHFSDMSIYETLPSWKLEYRAKLAELSKADETIYKILNNFIRGAKDDSTLSHPYGEYLVISNLSQALFNEGFVSDQERWKTIPVKDINLSASNALKENSLKLIKK